jgi:outer membrane biogenesis lipoprotein LolB
VKKLIAIILSLTALASCTSKSATEEKKATAPKTNLDHQTLDAVLRCLNDESAVACRMTAEGSITLSDAGSSQSGHFELKSKRLQEINNPSRVDSLSMIVTGPFGITGAKFVGSPNEYQFYNALEGENYKGKPDPKTLQEITGMKGLTLQSLSDVIYGLAPNGSSLAIGDTAILRSYSEYRHVIYIQRTGLNFTEAITLNGKLPATDSGKAKLVIIQYERWNKIIPFESTTLPKPDITISYEGLFDKKDFSLPNFIKASSGSTTLEIEYTSADQNPKNLTVKIKMPK